MSSVLFVTDGCSVGGVDGGNLAPQRIPQNRDHNFFGAGRISYIHTGLESQGLIKVQAWTYGSRV